MKIIPSGTLSNFSRYSSLIISITDSSEKAFFKNIICSFFKPLNNLTLLLLGSEIPDMRDSKMLLLRDSSLTIIFAFSGSKFITNFLFSSSAWQLPDFFYNDIFICIQSNINIFQFI